MDMLSVLLNLIAFTRLGVNGRSLNLQENVLALDLGFVVDGSKAIDEQGPGNFRKCMEFVKDILHSLPVGKQEVHAGLVTYGETAKVNFNLDSFNDQFSIDAAIDSAHYPATDPYAGNALMTTMSKVFPHSGRQNVPHVLVLIIGSSSLDAVESAAEELKASGVTIFCVGVGGRFDQLQLDEIASSPLDTYVMTTSFEALRRIVPALLWRIHEVFRANTRKPTEAPSPSLLTQGAIVEAKVDLGFLIDGSDTVGEQNYRTCLDFLKAVCQAFWTRFASLQVGLVVFGASAKLVVGFDNNYPDINSMANVINSATFPGGLTAIGEALKLAKTLLFGSKHHDSYRRILVVILGSTSEDDVFVGSEELQANGVTVFCIGVGNQYEWAQLDGIVSKPASQYLLTVDTYANLASVTRKLIDRIEEERTTYIPPKSGQTGNQAFPGNSQPSGEEGGVMQRPHPWTNTLQPIPETGISGAGTNSGSRPGVAQGQPSLPPEGSHGQWPGQVPPEPGTPTAISPTEVGSLTKRPHGKPLGGNSPTLMTTSKPLRTVRSTQRNPQPNTQPATVAPSYTSPSAASGSPHSKRPVFPHSPTRPVMAPTTQGSGKVVPPTGVTFPPQTSQPGKVQPPITTMPVNAVSSASHAVPTQDSKLDLAFLLDGSAKIKETGFRAATAFVKKVYSNFPIGQDATHVALLMYGNDPRTVFDLTEYNDRGSIDNRLLQITYPGSRKNMLGEGLVAAKETVFDVSARPGAHHVLVVIAAGNSTDDVREPSRFLRDKGVIIFGAGIGGEVDMTQLRDVVSYPEEDHLVQINRLDQLDKMLSPTVQNIRKAISQPIAAHATGPIGIRMELAFLLDVSAQTIQPEQFPNVLQFIKSTYGCYEVGQDRTRVGIVTYDGQRPQVIISLGQYTSIESLDIRVDQISLSPLLGTGRLGQGLTAVETQLLNGKTRPQTPKILVVITGGRSADDATAPSAKLKELNTTIFSVGVGDNVDAKQLGLVATAPASDHVLLTSISNRETAAGNLASRIEKTVKVDLGFLIDGSRNVHEGNFMHFLDIVRCVYDAFPISPEDVQVGLGVISSLPEIIFGFGKYLDKPSLNMAVHSVQYPGTQQNTNIGQSMTVAKELLFSKNSRIGARQVLVMLVSGKSQDDIVEPARRLRDNGIAIYCFGVGNNMAMHELVAMASFPSDRHIAIGNRSDLIEKLQIAKVEIDKKLIHKPYRARAGQETVEAAIDLAIIMEGSGHSKFGDFKRIKEIVKSIYYNFHVSSNGTHVAVAVYAEEMQIIFNLNQHYDHDSMDTDLETASFMPGLSNAGNALREVKTNILDANPRKGVPKVLITIMTGKSNDDIKVPVSELKDSFVLMFALGLTASYSPQDLMQASGEPHFEYVLISETFPDAVSIAKKMTDKIKKVVSVAESRSKACVQTGETRLDLVFIVDRCRNITANNFVNELSLVKGLYRSLPVPRENLRAAIITVSDRAKITQDLTTAPLNFSAALARNEAPGGGCLFGEALGITGRLFKTKAIKGVPQIGVLLMAGNSDDDVSQPARGLQECGVLLYAVGLGRAVNCSTIGNVTSAPVKEFFVSAADFPVIEAAERTLIDKLTRVLAIGSKLIWPSTKSLTEECQKNATSTNVPNRLPKTKTQVGPVDLVFLVDGSDTVNETLFRTLLDIVRNTYIRFPVSSDGTHVAFAVYGTDVRVVKNLKNYDVGTTDVALRSVSKPGGLCLAGKALAVVKNDIFDATGRPGETGATRVLLHIMCGKSLDDVTEPAKKLREEGVRIVAAGACPGDNKMDLCKIGSAPRCNNSVIIQMFTPPEIPAQELSNKLKEGVPLVKESTPGRNATEPIKSPFQPIRTFWSSPQSSKIGAFVPLIPSLLPVHPQAISPSYNMWNYVIPIQQDPVPPDPHTVGGNAMLNRNAACTDYDWACSAYGTNGFCDEPAVGFSTEYLMRMCKKSCGFCKPEDDLTDKGIWIKRALLPKPTQDLDSPEMIRNAEDSQKQEQFKKRGRT